MAAGAPLQTFLVHVILFGPLTNVILATNIAERGGGRTANPQA